jgi:hypothetical protein
MSVIERQADEYNRESVVVNTFCGIFFDLRCPVIVIYQSPSDFPGKYVARLWDLNKPTKLAVVRDTLDEIRQAIPDRFTRLAPSPKDDLVIEEIWI